MRAPLAETVQKARPLLKWAGGKRQLLDAIRRRLPDEIDTYYEPFVGGGAVFFALAAERRFRRAVLADQNVELIDTYKAVRDDVEGVIRELRKLPHTEDAYYRIRQASPRIFVKRAARMIYLNRTGYNGLYRVNRSGKFNVPLVATRAPISVTKSAYLRYRKPCAVSYSRFQTLRRRLRGRRRGMWSTSILPTYRFPLLPGLRSITTQRLAIWSTAACPIFTRAFGRRTCMPFSPTPIPPALGCSIEVISLKPCPRAAASIQRLGEGDTLLNFSFMEARPKFVGPPSRADGQDTEK